MPLVLWLLGVPLGDRGPIPHARHLDLASRRGRPTARGAAQVPRTALRYQ